VVAASLYVLHVLVRLWYAIVLFLVGEQVRCWQRRKQHSVQRLHCCCSCMASFTAPDTHTNLHYVLYTLAHQCMDAYLTLAATVALLYGCSFKVHVKGCGTSMQHMCGIRCVSYAMMGGCCFSRGFKYELRLSNDTLDTPSDGWRNDSNWCCFTVGVLQWITPGMTASLIRLMRRPMFVT
jgi:hypothetical protein